MVESRRVGYLRALHVGLVVVVVLLVCHWYGLAHVGGAGNRVRQRGAASSLVWRVRKLAHLTALTWKRRSHTTTATLIWYISEVTAWRRVAHVRLELRVEVSASTSARWWESTTSRAWALITHITVGRLGGLSTKVCRLIARSKRSLGCRSLSHVTLTNISVCDRRKREV